MSRQVGLSYSEPLHVLSEALEVKRWLIQDGILSWAARNLPRYPWRQSGRTPYDVIIGELWLKETSPAVATRIYEDFIQHFPSIQSLVGVTEDEITHVLSGFGVRQLTPDVKRLVDSLLKGGGNLPRDLDALVRLASMGPHCVRMVLCFGFSLPVAIIDTNVTRMLSRIFLNSLPPRLSQGVLEAVGESLVPCQGFQDYNRGFLDLAELLCRDEGAACSGCPVRAACDNGARYGDLPSGIGLLQ